MTEDRIHHQNISGISAQQYSQVFAGSAQNVYFANPQPSQEPLAKADVRCRDALFLTDPRTDRESLITAKGTRVSGTCEWITNDVIYRAWLACADNDANENHNNSQLLWISGGPGKGKTMLSIFLTEELERHLARTGNSELLFFFCSAQDEKCNTAIAVLRGLLHQIFTKRPKLIKHALPYLETPERKNQTLSSLEALWIIFSKTVSDIEFGTMFCVLDGLDECEESTRRALVSRLVSLLKDHKPPNKSLLRLVIISRDIPGLQDCPRIQLDPDNDAKVASDIERFVSSRVKELSQIKGFEDDPKKAVYVQRELLTRAERTFLWIGFAMDELLQQHTWTDVLCSLEELPKGLPAIYSRMLLGIPSKHREMSRLILCWVTLAVRPLELEELAAAICIRSSYPSRITEKQAILDAISQCGPLLQVQEEKISFIHQSARDYFLREKQDKNKILEEFRIEPKKTHLKLLEICIKCLNQSGFQYSALKLEDDKYDYESSWFSYKSSHPDILKDEEESPLLNYAAFHWPDHAKSCSARDVAQSDTLKQFFHERSVVRKNWWVTFHIREDSYLPSKLPLLHMKCYFGLVLLVEEAIVSEKWKPRFLKQTNKRDEYGDTPLHTAARRGEMEILQILIDDGADVNARDHYKKTVLHAAAGTGNQTTVQLLLDNGASANANSGENTSVLHEAVYSGSEAIMRLLLDRGADANTKNSIGETALHEAASSGREALVRLLLDRGADVDIKDESMETALHSAMHRGDEAVIRLMLEKGADVNAKNRYGETALHIAVSGYWKRPERRSTITKLLIDAGADVNAQSHDGTTIIQKAIDYRNEALVPLLKELGCK